ncbi:hypothetical protein GGP95_001896 [Salinibacter ruber]|nr:hypothetical protein [Salinibacter ruber]
MARMMLRRMHRADKTAWIALRDEADMVWAM